DRRAADRAVESGDRPPRHRARRRLLADGLLLPRGRRGPCVRALRRVPLSQARLRRGWLARSDPLRARELRDVNAATENGAPGRRGSLDRVLGGIERLGNKLPDPAVLFLLLMLAVWFLSLVLSPVELGAVHPA